MSMIQKQGQDEGWIKKQKKQTKYGGTRTNERNGGERGGEKKGNRWSKLGTINQNKNIAYVPTSQAPVPVSTSTLISTTPVAQTQNYVSERERQKLENRKAINTRIQFHGNHLLRDNWTLWFHSIKNMDWSLRGGGYEPLLMIASFEEFWTMYNALSDDILINNMYYLMKDGFPPVWDDPKMINGGAWTFRFNKNISITRFRDLCIMMINGNLPNDVIGVSLSPKLKNTTVRVWTKQDRIPEDFNSEAIQSLTLTKIDFSQARFTLNREAMR